MHKIEDLKAPDTAVARNDASEALLNSAVTHSIPADWLKQPNTAPELPKLQLRGSEDVGRHNAEDIGGQNSKEDLVGRHNRHGGYYPYPNPYGPARNPPTSILRADEITVHNGEITSGEVTRKTRM
jgi:hypothetical protein